MQRHAIRSTPTGSPQAGPVRVSRVPAGWTPYQTPWDAQVEFLRVEAARTPARRDTPGHSIEQYTGQRWAKPGDNDTSEEGDES